MSIALHLIACASASAAVICEVGPGGSAMFNPDGQPVCVSRTGVQTYGSGTLTPISAQPRPEFYGVLSSPTGLFLRTATADGVAFGPLKGPVAVTSPHTGGFAKEFRTQPSWMGKDGQVLVGGEPIEGVWTNTLSETAKGHVVGRASAPGRWSVHLVTETAPVELFDAVSVLPSRSNLGRLVPVGIGDEVHWWSPANASRGSIGTDGKLLVVVAGEGEAAGRHAVAWQLEDRQAIGWALVSDTDGMVADGVIQNTAGGVLTDVATREGRVCVLAGGLQELSRSVHMHCSPAQ